MNLSTFVWRSLGFALVLCSTVVACARETESDVVLVAVAANFRHALEFLEKDFEASTDIDIEISSGSTGLLYNQILVGAPFDIFLAADTWRPEALQEGALVSTGNRITYATGLLVLWSPTKKAVSAESLISSDVRRIAVANPELAPYGSAAQSVLFGLGLTSSIENKLVFSENVGQALVFAETRNVELAFVGLAQILTLPPSGQGAFWTVPTDLYAPINQQGVLLKRSEQNPNARAFWDYLQSPKAKAIIAARGYKIDYDT